MAPDLVLPDGAVLALDVPVVVGREPVTPPDLPGAIAVPIANDMSVSKTHALIEWSGGSLWVTDLNSANGTDVIGGDGKVTRLSPGIPAVFGNGATISVGSSSDLTFRPGLAPPSPVVSASTPVVSWYDDSSITAARRTQISPPPAASQIPSVVTPPPRPAASMVSFATQGAPPERNSVHSAMLSDVVLVAEADPAVVAAKLKQRRRLGAWILAAWGGLTALLTLTRESYDTPSLPLSFFGYPRLLLNTDLPILIASIPLAVGVTAAWLLADLTDSRRRSAVLWVTGASMPLLVINVVGIPFSYTSSVWSITSLVLPVTGAVLVYNSVERVHRPAGVVMAAPGQLAPGRAVAASPGGLVPLPLGARIGCVLLDSIFFIFTLGIGWVIWSLVLWGRGQTPGKQAVGAVVVRTDTGRVATFGTMALRELVGKSFLNFISFGLTSIASIFMVLFSPDRRAVQDHVATTIVISVHQLDRKP